MKPLHQNRVLHEWPTVLRTKNQAVLLDELSQLLHGVLTFHVGQHYRAVRRSVLAWPDLPEFVHGLIDSDGASIEVNVPGAVIDQSPLSGTRVAANTTIELTVAN